MRSFVGEVVDRIVTKPGESPVPYTGRRAGLGSVFTGSTIGGNREQQAAAMGGNGTLFAIVGGIAQDLAAVRWHLYRKSRSGRAGDRQEVDSHDALDRWNHPNPFMAGEEYRESVQQHLDLTGEGYNLFARSRLVSWPIEMWPVYPHRMTPVPSAERFLAGWVYRSPDGEEVPLDVDDVALIRQPHPLDFLRGLGVVEAISTDLESASEASEWNRNFFRNSALPGGIIEFPQSLQDDEFDQFRARWREQHQGVANAHRVALIEMGAKWVDRAYSMRDMQFVELRGVSREAIREAYRYPVSMLGESKDVNRATAEAQWAFYAGLILVPRLNRWKAMANHRFLPAFGATTSDLELDYDSPVSEDQQAENEERTSKAQASQVYIETGWEPNSVKDALGLPDALVWQGQPAPGQQLAPAGDSWKRLTSGLITPDRAPIVAAVIPPEVARVQQDWEQALDDLMADWEETLPGQRDQLAAAVETALAAGSVASLTSLAVLTDDQAAMLADAMAALGTQAGRRVAEEADAQGVAVTPIVFTAAVFTAVATVAAALSGQRLVASAMAAALRLVGYGKTATQIAEDVRTHLEGLSTAPIRTALGGSLTWAQNSGRLETFRNAPAARWTASEVLDTSTCSWCRLIDGHVFDDLDQVQVVYGGGGYILCAGRERCRGLVRAVWDDQEG